MTSRYKADASNEKITSRLKDLTDSCDRGRQARLTRSRAALNLVSFKSRIASSRKGRAMTTKEMIQAEIDNLNEEELKQLYGLVKDFTRNKSKSDKQSFMARLKEIKIDGPADFAENFDLYMSGEKRVE
jgi:hypothetical protein